MLPTLFGNRAYRNLVIGGCFAGVATYGKTLWEPTFLRRVYEMTPADVGVTYFFIYAMPVALGAYVGGRLGDRLARRDIRWHMWLSALATSAALPLSLSFLLLPADLRLGGIPLGFVAAALSSFLLGIWSPQSMALAQALSPLRMRTVSAAVWSSLFAFVGLGVGPYLVGELNVRLEPSLGQEAIRYSLASVSGVLLLAASFQLASGRTLIGDLERVEMGDRTA